MAVSVEGMSQVGIARRLGISRNTVSKASASNRPPKYERASRGSSVDAVEGNAVDFPVKLWNSIWTSAAVAGTALSLLTAFAIGIGRVRGRMWIVMIFQLANMLLQEVLLCPLYTMAQKVGLNNSGWSIVIIFTAIQSAFGTSRVASVLGTFPGALLEAAALDGANSWTVLWKVVFPIVRPTLSVLMIYFFIRTWNEFFIPLVMLTTPESQTVPIALASLQGDRMLDVPTLNAGALVSFVPILIFFLIFQRTLTRGVTAGAAKWPARPSERRSRLFTEGKERGYLLRRTDGSVWQTDLWQAGMALVDFTNPDACDWYTGYLRELLATGVDCFKTDFGERIPSEGVVYHDGSDPERMHNYYTHLYNQSVFDTLVGVRGEGEAVLFARSATAGGQTMPVHWGGDNDSTFASMAETLRGGLSLGLSGFGFWSHDIGGFEGTPDPWCSSGGSRSGCSRRTRVCTAPARSASPGRSTTRPWRSHAGSPT